MTDSTKDPSEPTGPEPTGPSSLPLAPQPPYASRWSLPCLALGLIALAGLFLESPWFLLVAIGALACGVLGHLEIHRRVKPPRRARTSALALGTVLGLGVALPYILYWLPTRRARAFDAYVEGTSIRQYPWQGVYKSRDAKAADIAGDELASGGTANVAYLMGIVRAWDPSPGAGAPKADDPTGREAERALELLERIGEPAAPAMLGLLETPSVRLRASAALFFLRTYDRRAFLRLARLRSKPLRPLLETVLYGLALPPEEGKYRHETAVTLLRFADPRALEDAIRRKREFTLEEAEAWFEARRASFPKQY